MDPGGKIAGGCFGDKGTMKYSVYKVLGVFGWKVQGLEAVGA